MTFLGKMRTVLRSFRVKVVNATPEMAEKIAQVELEAWGDPNYIPPVREYEERIRSFSDGVFVALYQGEVVGVIMVMPVPSVDWVMEQDDFREIVSHFGKIQNGDATFGVTWSVPPRGSALGATLALEAAVFSSSFFARNDKGIVLGARPLHYCEVNERCREYGLPRLSIEEYAALTCGEHATMFGKDPLEGNWQQKRFDAELRLYLDLIGCRLVGYKENYLPADAAVNEGWGVMVVLNNPVYNWPRPIRWLFGTVGPVLARIFLV